MRERMGVKISRSAMLWMDSAFRGTGRIESEANLGGWESVKSRVAADETVEKCTSYAVVCRVSDRNISMSWDRVSDLGLRLAL